MNWQDRRNAQAGGAEIHLHEVFGRLAARGHQVSLLVSGWDGAPARTRLDGMDVHRVGSRHTFPLAAPAYYRRRLARERHDLLIEDLNKVPVFAPLWAREPVILLVHHLFGGTAFQEASLPFATVTWLLEQPLPLFYRRLPVEAVSESTAADLVRRGFSRERITVIPNGVDATLYAPDPEQPRFTEPTLLYLGRLKRYKRVDLILLALATLRSRGIGARLLVAGRGDAADDLQALRDRLGLHEHVEFLGYVDEDRKRELLRRVWVHVLTSPKEGWGISNLEAAACGTPTVASDAPGLRDSVIDAETGFLVPHGDVTALAERLATLLGDAPLRERLGAAARRFALRHTWERAADDTERHLAAVLATHGA